MSNSNPWHKHSLGIPNAASGAGAGGSNGGSVSSGSGLILGAGRRASIVEMLSSPPPLPVNPEGDDIHSISLSRKTSMSSRASSVARGSVAGIDWAEIPLADLTESNKLIYIDKSYSVQKAFETLAQHNLTSVPVSVNEKDPSDLTNCLSFDYSDLNTYLLLIMNKVNFNELNFSGIGGPEDTPQEKQDKLVTIINKAKRGEEVPVDFIVKLHPKNPFVKFKELDTLYKVMETLGNGVHRVAITDNSSSKITGILSQRRLIKFMWENARRFPSLDYYLNATLQELQVGSNNPISINGDQPLIEALYKMFMERVSSLAVVDKNKTLLGNISIVDVKNVSSSKNSHMLFKSVLSFISYNLSQKGIEEGQDQYPIFHVNNLSSLGRVIAKLVATKSHRLWIVENRAQTPHNSVAMGGSIVDANYSFNSSSSSASTSASNSVQQSPKATPMTIEATLNQQNSIPTPISDSRVPDKLVGVISLTDILGLFAQTKTLKKVDPLFARNQRRRSSTSTTRSSVDSTTTGQDIFRKSYSLGSSESKR